MTLLVDALACYRLTRLVTTDRITQRLRAHAPGLLGELVGCDWCVSIYVGFGVVVARRVAPTVWDAAARALALSAVTGIIAENA